MERINGLTEASIDEIVETIAQSGHVECLLALPGNGARKEIEEDSFMSNLQRSWMDIKTELSAH